MFFQSSKHFWQASIEVIKFWFQGQQFLTMGSSYVGSFGENLENSERLICDFWYDWAFPAMLFFSL